MSETLLSIEGLSIAYQSKGLLFSQSIATENQVVKNISFSIKRGEIYGIIGESGCGKTTIARAISGLINYSGSIKFNGLELCTLGRKDRSRYIQMIFQCPYNSLNPSMKIKDILVEPLIIHNLYSKREREYKALEMLELIGIDPSCQGRYIAEMSGGQRQRISIGCALMLRPKLIVADEVLSSLDVSVQANILNIFQSLNENLGVTFLFISHNINVVVYFCHRIAVMRYGEIIETGDALQLYHQPIHPYTKLLCSLAKGSRG